MTRRDAIEFADGMFGRCGLAWIDADGWRCIGFRRAGVRVLFVDARSWEGAAAMALIQAELQTRDFGYIDDEYWTMPF